jgi:hypothetical protein
MLNKHIPVHDSLGTYTGTIYLHIKWLLRFIKSKNTLLQIIILNLFYNMAVIFGLCIQTDMISKLSLKRYNIKILPKIVVFCSMAMICIWLFNIHNCFPIKLLINVALTNNIAITLIQINSRFIYSEDLSIILMNVFSIIGTLGLYEFIPSLGILLDIYATIHIIFSLYYPWTKIVKFIDWLNWNAEMMALYSLAIACIVSIGYTMYTNTSPIF